MSGKPPAFQRMSFDRQPVDEMADDKNRSIFNREFSLSILSQDPVRRAGVIIRFQKHDDGLLFSISGPALVEFIISSVCYSNSFARYGVPCVSVEDLRCESIRPSIQNANKQDAIGRLCNLAKRRFGAKVISIRALLDGRLCVNSRARGRPAESQAGRGERRK